MSETPKFRVEWAEVARADLYAIIEYIAERDVNAAQPAKMSNLTPPLRQ